MAQQFTLTWAPGASASTQTIQYRVKNTGSWYTSPNIDPANPVTAATTTVNITDLSTNTVYQFQVLSNCCPGTQSAGAIVEGIIYEDMVATGTDTAGVISMTQTSIPAVDTITYKVADNNAPSVFLETITATGLNPEADFSVLPSGNYTVSYAYTTVVNGVNVNSYDADQENAWYETGTITI